MQEADPAVSLKENQAVECRGSPGLFPRETCPSSGSKAQGPSQEGAHWPPEHGQSREGWSDGSGGHGVPSSVACSLRGTQQVLGLTPRRPFLGLPGPPAPVPAPHQPAWRGPILEHLPSSPLLLSLSLSHLPQLFPHFPALHKGWVRGQEATACGVANGLFLFLSTLDAASPELGCWHHH